MRKNFGLVPYSPFGDGLRKFFGDEDFFGDDFFGISPRTVQDFSMLTGLNRVRSDIKETETSYVVEAELPGFNKEDIKLDMENGVLTISAKTNSEKEDKNDNYVRKERYSGTFMRQYAFDNVNEDAITAKYNNGVLEVELPKKEKTEPKKGITIE